MPYIPNYKLLRSHVRGRPAREITCRFNPSDIRTLEVLAAKYKMKRSDVLRGIVRELERRPALIEDMFGHLQPKGDWLWLESQKP